SRECGQDRGADSNPGSRSYTGIRSSKIGHAHRHLFFPAIPLLLENRWNADFHVFGVYFCVQLGNAGGVEKPRVGEPICCTATSAGACDSMTAPTLSTSVALHVDWRSAGLSYAFAVTGGGRRE